MAEPDDMILPLLREMRAETNARLDRFDGVDRRLASIDNARATFRRALGAGSLMSKFVIGEFEERLEALERKVRALETSK